MRRPLVIGLAVALAAAGGVTAFLVLRDDESHARAPAEAAPEEQGETTVELPAGTLAVESVGAPTAFPEPLRDEVLAVLGAWIDAGIVAPLRSGETGQLADAFGAAAELRLLGPDGAVLLDLDLPEVDGAISARAEPVAMTGLADGSGNVVLVTAAVALTVDADADAGAVTTRRFGELVLAPESAGWRITGWDLAVERSAPDLDPAPTTAVSP